MASYLETSEKSGRRFFFPGKFKESSLAATTLHHYQPKPRNGPLYYYMMYSIGVIDHRWHQPTSSIHHPSKPRFSAGLCAAATLRALVGASGDASAADTLAGSPPHLVVPPKALYPSTLVA